jgi:hypothetical protein
MTKKITLSIYNQNKKFFTVEEFEEDLDTVVPTDYWDDLDNFTKELEYQGSLLHVQKNISINSADISYITEDHDKLLEQIYKGSNLLKILNLLKQSTWNADIVIDDFIL